MVLRNARPLWNKKWTRRLNPAFLVFDVLGTGRAGEFCGRYQQAGDADRDACFAV